MLKQVKNNMDFPKTQSQTDIILIYMYIVLTKISFFGKFTFVYDKFKYDSLKQLLQVACKDCFKMTYTQSLWRTISGI